MKQSLKFFAVVFITAMLLPVTQAGGVSLIEDWPTGSGYNWQVRQAEAEGPGPNDWSSDNVATRAGNLVLKLVYRDDRWTSAEVTLEKDGQEHFGFGTYQFTVTGPVDFAEMHPNIVLGFFPYATNYKLDKTNEIDIEITKWGPKSPIPFIRKNNLHYTIYPAISQTGYRNKTKPFFISGKTHTHRFIWQSHRIVYQCFAPVDGVETELHRWTYQPENPRKYIPQYPLEFHINLWLFRGDKQEFDDFIDETLPRDRDFKIVISDFKFNPLPETRVPRTDESSAGHNVPVKKGRIAYHSYSHPLVFTNNPNEGHIFVADLQDSRVNKLTDGITGPVLGYAMNPHFSPAGDLVTFMAVPAELSPCWENMYVYLYDVVYDRLYKLHRGQDPKFSPDGRSIVFKYLESLDRTGEAAEKSSPAFDQWQVWTIDLNGGNQVRITSSPGEKSGPNFSPDGSQIVYWISFASDQKTEHDIYRIRSDGTGERKVLGEPGLQEMYPIFRDNDRILFTRWATPSDHSDKLYQYRLSTNESKPLEAVNFKSLTGKKANDSDPFPLGPGLIGFSSDRPGNLGGWDIYIANPDAEKPMPLFGSLGRKTVYALPGMNDYLHNLGGVYSPFSTEEVKLRMIGGDRLATLADKLVWGTPEDRDDGGTDGESSYTVFIEPGDEAEIEPFVSTGSSGPVTRFKMKATWWSHFTAWLKNAFAGHENTPEQDAKPVPVRFVFPLEIDGSRAALSGDTVLIKNRSGRTVLVALDPPDAGGTASLEDGDENAFSVEEINEKLVLRFIVGEETISEEISVGRTESREQ